ncbi:MAG: ABC transporter ATP-binding protein [candidate division NC10 bacterium]|nr:ABC transporter ATP-binding protein [candidate division NC10 bacterium]MBI4412882.1 ABC transporter ATP-binding protein [candidate division NC10 bacterium]
MEVRVEGLTKRYGRIAALEAVSIAFPSGGLTAILGPSGCGKTTLLRSVAGFVAVDGGRVLFGGEEVTRLPPQGRGTAMVFQNYALWPHMTVFDNVAYGLRLKKLPEAEVRARVEKVLHLVEIGHLAGVMHRKPAELSGGQQQRVALARALVVEPRVLLMDEPLSNLDAKVRQRLRVEVRRLQKAVGITAIYVTHDQEEALAIADTVVLMDAGRVIQTGSPQEIYFRPRSAFAAEFLGVSNQLRGTAETGALAIGTQRLPYTGSVRGLATLIFKASDASLAAADLPTGPGEAALRGTLEERLFLGAVYRHYVRVEGETVMVDAAEPVDPGPVTIRLPAGKVQVYAAPEAGE